MIFYRQALGQERKMEELKMGFEEFAEKLLGVPLTDFQIDIINKLEFMDEYNKNYYKR